MESSVCRSEKRRTDCFDERQSVRFYEFGHARAEWLFECHRDEAGTLLRVVVDSAGAIGIELVD